MPETWRADLAVQGAAGSAIEHDRLDAVRVHQPTVQEFELIDGHEMIISAGQQEYVLRNTWRCIFHAVGLKCVENGKCIVDAKYPFAILRGPRGAWVAVMSSEII